MECFISWDMIMQVNWGRMGFPIFCFLLIEGFISYQKPPEIWEKSVALCTDFRRMSRLILAITRGMGDVREDSAA